MKETVYFIEKRGEQFIFHWLFYMIAGLYDVKDKEKPIKFSLEIGGYPVQYETFELLKPDFEYIQDITGYNIEHLPGAHFKPNSIDCVHDHYYNFIREQILIKNNLTINSPPFRYIYISRNNSHELKCNNGLKKRQIVNENEVYNNILKKYNFEFIYLEKLSFKEKIKLFQEAKCIVTPNGGALTFSAFANENTQIIEIHSNRIKNADQHYNIAKVLGIKIERYTNVEFISDRNYGEGQAECWIEFAMKINDLNDFENFIIKYI